MGFMDEIKKIIIRMTTRITITRMRSWNSLKRTTAEASLTTAARSAASRRSATTR